MGWLIWPSSVRLLPLGARAALLSREHAVCRLCLWLYGRVVVGRGWVLQLQPLLLRSVLDHLRQAVNATSVPKANTFSRHDNS